jgi:hypothetical protein
MADNVARADTNAWSDSTADVRWLSYDDLAEITGIKRNSVTRMVRRKKWSKRTGNERGSVRVAVPADAIEDMEAKKTARPPAPPEPPALVPILPDTSAGLADIIRAIGELEAALIDVRGERDQLRAERDQLKADREQLKSDLAREREAMSQVRVADERERATDDEERAKVSDHRTRLNAQVIALSAELARLHAFPRAANLERAATVPSLLTRVASLARRFGAG